MNTLQKVWDILFGGLPLDPNEYIELGVDDRGDKIFNRAYHVKSLEELEEKVKELSGKCNIAISPSIQRIEDGQKDKIIKNDSITKEKAIILDIDNPNNHTFLREEDTRKWYASWKKT